MLRDAHGQPTPIFDALAVDPNGIHPFIEHDLSRRCYVCNRKRTSDWHRTRQVIREERPGGDR